MSTLSLSHDQITHLFKEHRKALTQFLVYRIRCPETAQDLCQETYMRLLRDNAVTHDENLSGFLFRVADRLAINYLKWQRIAINNGLSLHDDLVCPEHLPDELTSLRQQCEILLDAINSLPQKYRHVFLLRKIDEIRKNSTTVFGKSHVALPPVLGTSRKPVASEILMNVSTSKYSMRQFKQAIEWFVSLESDHCSAEQQRQFETWLTENENHRAAFVEAERVWANMDALKLLPVPGLDEARSAKPRKSSAAQLAFLAIFILTSALLGGAWLEYSAETINYSTKMGEHRRIELADSSHIDLNTDTRISVRMSFLQRNVKLTQGEALFEVNHNFLRPFIVQVGDLRIRDVGTRFNVRKQAEGVTISVLEGEVELNNGQSVNNKHLVAGNQFSYSEMFGLGQLEAVEANQLTAWVNGKLVFKRAPLSEITAELERYHPVQFSFADPKLAQETLSGTFDADDIKQFLHALETILPIQAKRNGLQIQLRQMPKN